MSRCRPLSRLAAALTAGGFLLSGCGGGGGGGSSTLPTFSPTVGPTATPTSVAGLCAGTAPSIAAPPFVPLPAPSSTAVPSSYQVQSNPSGLTVLLNGTVVGTTPTTVVPKPSFSGAAVPSQITVRSGSQPDYTVTFNQLYGNSQTVFYNRLVDSQGSISPNYQSVARARNVTSSSEFVTTRRPVFTALRQLPVIDPNHLFVKYQLSSLTQRQPRDIEAREGLSGGNDVMERNGQLTRVLSIPSGQSYETIAAKLTRYPEVAKVDHVHLRYPLGLPVIPNDTHFQLANQQWDMFQIGMPQAWSYGLGQGATIAVLDTGYDGTSQDFSKVKQAYTFQNGAAPTGGAIDTDGHGSNTAGIAGAVTNNGCGFASVGFNAGLMILKIIGSSGSISTADEANAIKFATDNGARVISMSIGGPQTDASGAQGYDDVEAAAVNYALAHNVVVVAAAGNESLPYTPNVPPVCRGSLPACGVTNLDYPAAYPGVISVGASACQDNGSACTTEYVASYSNGGPGLGLVAPGGDPTGGSDNDNFHWIDNLSSPLNSQFPCRQSAQPDGVCSNQFAGTSQATPHVAGAAALVLALNPNLGPAQVAQLLYETADNLTGVDPNFQGHGRLNVARAMAKLAGDASFPTYRPALNQFIAFAYTNSGAVNIAPQIIDLFYTKGVPVDANGNFRIADINPSGPYKIGVWYNAAANGVVTTGDYFGSTGSCSTTSPCQASNITVSKLGSNVIP